MNPLRPVYEGFRRLSLPVRHNGLFFVTMYALLAVSLQLEHMSDLHALYYTELFFDVYLLCALFYVLPRRVARGVRFACYLAAYVTSVCEGFIYQRFSLRFSPITMQLFVETNPDEASEFLRAYLWSEAAATTLLAYGSVLAVNVLLAVYGRRMWRAVARAIRMPIKFHPVSMLLNLLIPTFFAYSVYAAWSEKKRMYDFFFQANTASAERTSWLYFYSPFYRLLYSFKFMQLAGVEGDRLRANMRTLRVDSCRFSCPNIVLLIGESYNKRHASLYGYGLPTTPYMDRFAGNRVLVSFSDVVTPWNVTSNAFKNFLSTHSADQPGSWADGVLFPALFRKAGYRVAFITNQFIKDTKQTLADFNGSFFLNDEELDSLSFDYRNTHKSRFDRGLVEDIRHYKRGANNLIIFHVMGQHLEYQKRYPKQWARFTEKDIDRPDLNELQRSVVATYDNATLYNDWIMARVCSFFKDDDAIVIYMPDHGEEVYGELNTFGRLHNAEVSPALARAEFEIPFAVWMSRTFRRCHRSTMERIRQAADKPFCTDDLPHLMLGLAGIACPQYDPRRDLFSAQYEPGRPRILKQSTDYDSLMLNEKRILPVCNKK